MYAVIKTGGKQYRVAANDKIRIEKLEGQAGDQIHFSDVLLVANGESIEVGAPLVSGATVVGEIAEQEKLPTVYIFKKRRRKHYRRRNGHRQLMTSVTITEILTGGAKPSGVKAEAKAKAETKPAKAEKAEKAAKPAKAKAADADAAPMALADTAMASSGKADDISLIGGIGPKMQKTLTDMGINTFAQIAAWTEADIEKLEDAIKPKGRIAREEWVEQAKELMAGKPPRAKADRERE